MNTEFKEEQKLTQWWLWVIMFGIGAIPIYGIYKQIIIGEKFGNNPMSDTWLIIFAIFIFSLIALLWFTKLTTEINKNSIKINFFPFIKKNIEWSEIKNAEVIDYGFVGGWGIRLWTKYGTIYNTKGKIGLAIKLNNGKKLLIGTQKKDELKKVINEIMPVNG